MFDSRQYIGLPFEVAKARLQSLGYEVQEKENTADDRHAFDTTLVVRVDKNDNLITLVTSKFLMKI